MRVLVACEYTGIVRNAFRALGYDAWSNDIDPAEDNSPYHIQGDALEVSRSAHWDLMIAHPPCTFLCNAGVRWLTEKEGRWQLMREGARFYTDLALAPIKFKAVENPIMHGFARAAIPLRWTLQYIQPWEHGHAESKRTGLELWNLPKLAVSDFVPPPYKQSVWAMPPSDTRGKDRSRTFPGIAKALAEQYGRYVAERV